LLKNKGAILPLQSSDRLAFIGDFAYEPRYQGAGSSKINPTQLDTILDVKDDLGWEDVAVARGYRRDGKKDEALVDEAVELSRTADKVVVFMGLTEISESEGIDRTHIKIEDNQLTMLQAIVDVNPNVVVVLSGGAPVELPFADQVGAIVHTYLSGQAGARATLAVLSGEVNPSGKLNESYPLESTDVPNVN